MEEEKTTDNVRAVSRALDILLAFKAGDGDLLVGDILKRVDLSRPTLYPSHYTQVELSSRPRKFEDDECRQDGRAESSRRSIWGMFG
jgi:hypothetical protein